MKEFSVSFLPSKPYPSLDEAIAAATSSIVGEEARRAGECLQNRRILAASWTDSSLTLSLSGDKSLRVSSSSRGGVRWSIADTGIVSNPAQVDEPVTLMFKDSNTRLVWDRAALIRKRIGKTISGLYADGLRFYIYTIGEPILLISPLVIHPNNIPALFWGDSD